MVALSKKKHFSQFCAPLAVQAQWSCFTILSPLSVPKLELKQTEICVLKFWIHKKLQATMLQKVFSSMGTCLFLISCFLAMDIATTSLLAVTCFLTEAEVWTLECKKIKFTDQANFLVYMNLRTQMLDSISWTDNRRRKKDDFSPWNFTSNWVLEWNILLTKYKTGIFSSKIDSKT